MNRLTMHTVTLIVVDLRDRCVDGNLVEVRTAQTRDLRVDVGMNATREQWIIREINAWHDVRDAERNLLSFGKEVVRISIQDHPADRNDRHKLLRDDLGGVEHIEA